MNTSVKSRIDTLLHNGFEFRFEHYIKTGFGFLVKNLGGFVVFAFAMLAIVMVVSFIPFIGALANQFILVPIFTVGFFLVANVVQKGREPQFGDYVRGFDYVGQLALATLAKSIITLLSLIPFFIVIRDYGLFEWYAEILQNPTELESAQFPEIPFWPFILLLPALYFGIAYSWAYMFIVFYGFGFWEALETSRKLITRKLAVFTLFFILLGIIAGAGILIFCIGILATIPAFYCMNYAAFEDITSLLAGENSDESVSSEDLLG